MTGHRLAVREATKRYGRTTALQQVSFEVDPGCFLVLLGPSGSGKSTLVRSLAGVERLDAGQIQLGSLIVDATRRYLPPERRELAMVFQDYALWPHLTALGNVSYALRRRQLPRTAARQASLAALDRVGLAGYGHRYPNELSGGEQQRVALARAVVARPGLLLFDEPLSNLDADLRERLRIEISTLTRECGATSVYITHDQSEAFALADVVGVLHEGRLVQLGTPEAVYATPASAFVAEFTGLAGRLAVDVADRGPADRVWVRGPACPGGTWARACAPLGEARSGELLVRPAAPRLHPPTEPAGELAGTVRDVAFRGRGYDHVVDLAGGATLVGVFSERRWGRGENVGVSLDPGGCLLFPGRPAALRGDSDPFVVHLDHCQDHCQADWPDGAEPPARPPGALRR